jgi:cytidylate kinase
MTDHPAITISRSLGCGGTEIGFRVARRLGWQFCDRRILRLSAEAMGRSVGSLAPQEEHHCGFLEVLKNLLAFGSPEAPYVPLLDLPIYSRDLFALEREIMLRMVQRAPSVIVGRGGFVALRGRPATLHVSLDADPGFRVRSLVARGRMPDLEAARRAVAASDRDRAAFLRDISGRAWRDPRHFDLVLDVAKEGLEACVERILAEAPKAAG